MCDTNAGGKECVTYMLMMMEANYICVTHVTNQKCYTKSIIAKITDIGYLEVPVGIYACMKEYCYILEPNRIKYYIEHNIHDDGF